LIETVCGVEPALGADLETRERLADDDVDLGARGGNRAWHGQQQHFLHCRGKARPADQTEANFLAGHAPPEEACLKEARNEEGNRRILGRNDRRSAQKACRYEAEIENRWRASRKNEPLGRVQHA
jgi:hypothetical protein